MRVTITEALRRMRALHDADAGQLQGLRLRYRWRDTAAAVDTAALPPPWATGLVDRLRGREAGIIDTDTPEYVVCSARVPVVWLTVHAHLVTPPAPLSRTQARHQQQASQVLADLHRHTLRELADARQQREHPHDPPEPQPQPHVAAVRVAPGDDPTATCWVRLDPDLLRAEAAVAEAVAGLGGGPPLIISADGYGGYGRYTHRLDLPVLCAIGRVAEAHQLPPAAVGDWLAREGATTGQVDPATVPTQFEQAYLGQFDSREAFVEDYLTRRGWRQALAAADIDQRYLDRRQLAHDLFTGHVFDVDIPHPSRRIAVFTRAAAATPPPVAACQAGGRGRR